MIDLDNLLKDDENGIINRLKLQKYVYLAQTSLQKNFGYEFNIYNNGPYSPELANYYYEKMDLDRMTSDVRNSNWNCDNSFIDRFLALFKDKEPAWLEVASTLIDSTHYCEDEQECLNKVYAIKSTYSRSYIDKIWNELKDNSLVHLKSGLKLNNLLSIF